MGKAQAHSQLGEGEEGLDIKGWAGQLPAPKARWPLSGQAKHRQDNGVSCSLSGRQESLPSQGPACYMTKGGPIKRSGRPLLKLSLCPALSPAFEEGGSERPAWGQEVHRLRSQTVATFPTAAAVPSPRVKSSGRALDGKVGTLNHHRCNQRRLFFSPKDMTRQSLHYTDRGLRPGKESDLCVYAYSACPLGACSLEAGIGVQGTDDHLDQCCQKFTQG